jgi:hypothetical protein
MQKTETDFWSTPSDDPWASNDLPQNDFNESDEDPWGSETTKAPQTDKKPFQSSYI